MKIWIHIDGVQQGPFDIDALPLDRMTADTPVWYAGLTNWTKASEAPATARFFGNPEQEATPEIELVQEMAQEAEPESLSYHQRARQEHAQYFADHSDEDMQHCPANYLVWSILLTLVCCNPIGIIPIITGATVRSRWRNQNFDSAHRLSETTAWWLMITIVTSLMLAPLAMMVQSL